MPAAPVKRLFRVEAGKCHRCSPLGSGVSGRIRGKKGQGVGSALPQLLLQQCCSADSRGVSERLWRPALRPLARVFGVKHHGHDYLQCGRIINTSDTSELTRTACQIAIAVGDVTRAIWRYAGAVDKASALVEAAATQVARVRIEVPE